MFSTPILTSIFGDGSLEVKHIKTNEAKTKTAFASVLNQGNDEKDAEVEVHSCMNYEHFGC